MNERMNSTLQISEPSPSVMTVARTGKALLKVTPRGGIDRGLARVPGPEAEARRRPAPPDPQTHLVLQVVKLHSLGLPGRPVLLFPLQIPVENI